MGIRKVAVLALTATMATAVVVDAFAESRRQGNGHRAQLAQRGILAPAVPTAGGSCGTPTVFASTPYSDTGTTTGATNIISTVPSSCTGWARVAGPQVVYSFTAGAAANLTFTVTPGNSVYDTSIYLVSTCTDGNTCVGGSDYYYQYDPTPETFSVSSLTAGTTYYLHIDSYYSTSDPAPYSSFSNGPYSLSVTGSLPVQLQEFQID